MFCLPRFEVEVRGEPQPAVTWYKNEVKLQPSDKVKVIEERNKTTLTIDNVNPEDVGDYICVAENERGVVTCKSTLIIKCKYITVWVDLTKFTSIVEELGYF